MEGHDIVLIISQYYQARVPAKEYIDDRSLAPTIRDLLDSFKNFNK